MQLPIELTHPCYHDEEAARAQLESIRWPDGPYCPICGRIDDVKPTPPAPKAKGGGWYHCRVCRRKFTVRVGSIFHRSHVPLHKWLLAFRRMAGSKKGVSAHQLHRELNVDYKTAWFLEHRIRECMDMNDEGPIGGEGKTVEADETYVNKQLGRGRWVYSNERGWVKARDRYSLGVFALVERGGQARAMPIASTTAHDLRRALKRHADTKSALMTDELPGYRRPGREFASHDTVNHSVEEWTRETDQGRTAGTQHVENFFSVFKRGMRGVYQHCSDKHLAATCMSSPSAIRIGRRSGSRTQNGQRWRFAEPMASGLCTGNLVTKLKAPVSGIARSETFCRVGLPQPGSVEV